MADNLSGMDLAELIRRTKGDRSYEQLADAAPESPARQRWQQMGSASSARALPAPRTVRAMASVLGVSERVVVLAAARSAGLDVDSEAGSLGTLLPPSAKQLSETQVAAVLAVIRAMLEPHHAPPMTKQQLDADLHRLTLAGPPEEAPPPPEKIGAKRQQ